MTLDKIKKNQLYREGTTYDDEEERKRQEKEEREQRRTEATNLITNYSSLKRNSMKEIGSAVKARNESRKKQEEEINNKIKKQVNNVNNEVRKNNPQTVTLPTAGSNYRDIMTQNEKDKSDSIMKNMKVLTQKDKDKFIKTGKVGNGELFKLTNGQVDDRTKNQKIKDDIVAPIANIGVGIESVLPAIANYEDAGAKQLFKLGTEATLRSLTGIDKDPAISNIAKTVGGLAYEKIGRKAMFSDRLKEDLEAEKEWRNKTIESNINKTSNIASKKIAELAPSLGQNVLPMAVSAVSPVAGTALFMASAGGNYLEDAKERGMNEDQAYGYATVMGLAEGGSEALISGGMLSRVKKAFTGKALSDTFLNSLGTEIAENFTQEAVMEPLQEGTATVFGGKETANWDNIGQRTLQAGLDGVLSALLLKGASIGIVSSQNVMNKIENNQTVTETDITNMINDLKKYDRTGYEETVQGAVEAIKTQMKNIQQNQSANQLPVANNTNQNIKITPRVQNQQVEETLPVANEKYSTKVNNLANNQNINQNKIDKKVNEYVKSLNNNFESNININTDIVNKNNANIVDYKTQNQGVIYNKAKELFSKIHKRVFKNNNQNIYVTNSDIKESIEKTIKNPAQKLYLNENIAVFSQLDKIIENAELIDTQPIDRKNRSQYKNYEYYVSKVNIDGKPYIVEFDTRLQEGASGKPERHFRLERVYNINEVISQTGTDNSINQIGSDITSSNNSITPPNENVNSTNYDMQNIKNNTPKANEVDVAPKAKKINYDIQSEDNKNIINELATSDRYKFRKHYDSVIKSQYTTDEAKKISKQLMKSDAYVPESNNKQLERADERIRISGAESELNSLMSRAMTGGNIKADDIAVGERLIQYYSKNGDKAKLQEAIQATAMAGTTAGQTVQAMSLLNHQTPEGQAIWLQRSVEKMNNDLKKRRGQDADQFDLTPEMTEKIVNSKNAEELQSNLNDVYAELGQQVSKSTIEKIDAWRYFSMLANPRTHIRNITGNVAMGKVQGIKNKVAGVIEGTVAQFNPEMERTHTIVPASKEVKQFAKNDIINVADRLELNDNKYNPKTRLENSMRTFSSNAFENTLGKLFEFNNKALEVEDAWGLKSAYVKSLSEYMTANELTPETITDKQLAKARNYAVEQAKEATFHQASALATALNQFSNKNGVTKFISDAVIPFKKTPVNVAKAGLEYSPAGLAKSAIYDTVQLRKGNITVNQYIDNISKGLTGTGITLLGYALAEAGILKANGGDDKDKENYDKDRGQQTYSITIGDNTYSLDWLAPTGIPLFIGAEIHENMQQSREIKKSSSDDDKAYDRALVSAMNIFNSFTNAVDPMTEMSMLSGLSSTLKSYDNNLFAGIAVNAGKSYINQFVPTVLGQIAKTTDEYERSTSSTKTGTLPKAIDSTKNQIMAKIPGLRQQLPTKTDIWGNDQKQSENILQRGLENAIFPWTRKELASNSVDKEIQTLYKNTGESSVLPDNINKEITIDKQKYVMTSDEYAKYKKQYGQNSYELLNKLVTSSDYKKLTDKQKQVAIEKVYSYAKEQIKVDYAKNNKLEYKESTLSTTVNALKKSNGNVSNYFEYIANTQDMKKNSEKINELYNSNYSNKTKELIYENNLLEDKDKKYDVAKAVGTNINEYLKYKTTEFESDKKDDGTVKGKTISGSLKNKVDNYISNMNITGVQKKILYGLEYAPNKQDKQIIVNYITTLPGKTKQQKLDMLSQFSWITLYKNGKYDY